MGYTVTVTSRSGLRQERAVFSENISHTAMRRALTTLVDVTRASAPTFMPWRVLDALCPGYNGVSLSHRDCRRDLPALYLAMRVTEDAGDPDAWVLRILWEAMAYAEQFRGTVHFD